MTARPAGQCPATLDTFVLGLSLECQRTGEHTEHEHTSDRGHARWQTDGGRIDVSELRVGGWPHDTR